MRNSLRLAAAALRVGRQSDQSQGWSHGSFSALGTARWTAVLAFALLSSIAASAAPETGFVSLPYTVEGQARTAALYVPPDYDASKAWPLIVYLHGGGGKGDNAGDAVNDWMERQPIVRAIRAHPERFPALVLVPRCPRGRIWAPIPANPVQSAWRLERHGVTPAPAAEDHVTAAIAAAVSAYAVNENRITLAGYSMGGEGSIRYAALHSDRIAGVAPSAGSAVVVLEDASALAGMGVWMFQGETDPISTVALARRMVEAIRAAGGDVRYTEFKGVGHGTAGPAYNDPQVIDWLLSQRRR